jgi:hypothetical protein
MTNTFFYEDGQENVYNEQGIKAFDPIGDTLTQITDPNIVLETITSQGTYLATRKSILEVDLYIPSKDRARGWTLGVLQSLDGNA